jgi:hypothetical protein
VFIYKPESFTACCFKWYLVFQVVLVWNCICILSSILNMHLLESWSFVVKLYCNEILNTSLCLFLISRTLDELLKNSPQTKVYCCSSAEWFIKLQVVEIIAAEKFICLTTSLWYHIISMSECYLNMNSQSYNWSLRQSKHDYTNHKLKCE